MLTTLCMEKYIIDEDGMIDLASALENHMTLEILILSRNEIGPLRIKYLADAVHNNTVLSIVFSLYLI